MKRGGWAVIAPVLALVPAACGGSSGGNNTFGGPACSVGPCGGNITGTWNVSDVCLSKSILMMALTQEVMGVCPSATVGNSSAPTTGSLVFNTDSSYSIDLAETVSLGMNLPISCFPGATCADLNTQFMQQATGDPTVQSASCAGTNPCICTITSTPMQISEAGSYSVSGSTLTTSPTTGATPSSLSYCVKDQTLTFKDASPDPSNPVTAIVATKAP